MRRKENYKNHMQVPASVVPQIVRKELDAVEQQHGVTVLYACESGSRAWGIITSPDNDFDVRFIYAYAPADYLSITDRPNQIHLPLSDQLEITGWDIRKALRLFLESNAALYEWLQSPLVYHGVNGFGLRLRELAPAFFSLRTGLHFYLAQTRKIFDRELQGPEVNLTHYFYAFRTLLASRWIVRRRTVPPMALAALLEVLEPGEQEVRQVFEDLVARKAMAGEKLLMPSIKALQAFMRAGIAEGLAMVPAVPVKQGEQQVLDQLFREVISEAAQLKNGAS